MYALRAVDFLAKQHPREQLARFRQDEPGDELGRDLAARIDQRFDESLLGEGAGDVGELRSDPGAAAIELMAPIAARRADERRCVRPLRDRRGRSVA